MTEKAKIEKKEEKPKTEEKPKAESKEIQGAPEKLTLIEAIKAAKKDSRPRKFNQTWDLIITLTGFDIKKTENRLNLEFQLPEGRGKDLKVAVIADSLVPEARKLADLVITKEEIEPLANNKPKLKRLAKEYDWFLGEAPLMPLVGKSLGQILGTRGKMPKPVPPKVKIEPFIMIAKKSVRVRIRDSPVIQVSVGTESMEPEKVAKNVQALYNFVKEKLPRGKDNIGAVQVKLTMGRPKKAEMV